MLTHSTNTNPPYKISIRTQTAISNVHIALNIFSFICFLDSMVSFQNQLFIYTYACVCLCLCAPVSPAHTHTHKDVHFLLSVYLSRSLLYKVFVYGFVRVPQSVVKFDFIFNFQPRIERSFRRLYERSRTNGPTTVVQAALSSGHIQIL